MIKYITPLLLLFIIAGTSENISAQKKAKVTIVKANLGQQRAEFGPNVRLLLGNVILRHENTLMHCDSAYFHDYKGLNLHTSF